MDSGTGHGQDSGERRARRAPRPLDAVKLHDLALFYVSRFATTRAKLATYLRRKLRERGWSGDAPADIDAVVERLVAMGAIDDAAWASARSGSLTRAGYGQRRVWQALFAAGVQDGDAAAAISEAVDATLDAALRYARRRRFGPYAPALVTDPALRERQIGAFVRAGHAPALARRIVALAPDADVEGLRD